MFGITLKNLNNNYWILEKKYGTYKLKKGCGWVLVKSVQNAIESTETAKLELYRLIGEGYNAMQNGRTSTIDEVRDNLNKRRAERG